MLHHDPLMLLLHHDPPVLLLHHDPPVLLLRHDPLMLLLHHDPPVLLLHHDPLMLLLHHDPPVLLYCNTILQCSSMGFKSWLSSGHASVVQKPGSCSWHRLLRYGSPMSRSAVLREIAVQPVGRHGTLQNRTGRDRTVDDRETGLCSSCSVCGSWHDHCICEITCSWLMPW